MSMTKTKFSFGDFKNIREAAKSTNRLRANVNLHKGYQDNIQYFVNYICRDSYIVPHAHYKFTGNEILVPLSGEGCLITFDNKGRTTSRTLLATISNAIDADNQVVAVVAPETWHTVVALSEDFCLLEIKNGPFKPEFAKLMAEWAPTEGAEDASTYLKSLVEDTRAWLRDR